VTCSKPPAVAGFDVIDRLGVVVDITVVASPALTVDVPFTLDPETTCDSAITLPVGPFSASSEG